MRPLLVALITLSLLELALWLPGLWRVRKVWGGGILLTLSVVTGLMIGGHFSGWVMLISLFSLYRMVNLLRLIEGRLQVDYLYHATRRTSLWLMALQGGVLLAWLINQQLPVAWWQVIAVAQLVVALGVAVTLRRNLQKSQPPVLHNHFSDQELPPLTVAIPARNETTDLERCLESLVASDYPKLEILVLDDCSQTKRTPEIIRQFAQSGVRFIAGETPPGHWLAKNYAYEQLQREANGDLLLFCGVDTRFEPDSLRGLVSILLTKQKSMLSVLPRNLAPSQHRLWSRLLQTNRYAWELALPRRALNRPPVLSTCWLITREQLETAGGFAATRHGVLSERYFARQAAKHDGYSFLVSNATTGVTCRKELSEQAATAVRIRYPQLHRRPELTALVSLAELAVLIGPLSLAFGALLHTHWGLVVLAGLAWLLQAVIYDVLFSLTYRRLNLFGLLLQPVAALFDIGLLNYSLWRYEFREVIWKGRNVCLPLNQDWGPKS